MNKRNILLDLINSSAAPSYIPTGFFLHFDPTYHRGQAAVDKQLEFFRATEMDFIKIQYEQIQPPTQSFSRPEDWAQAPRYAQDFFEPTIRVAEGLVKAAAGQAPVILTIYSPFIMARQLSSDKEITRQLRENPDAVSKGLEIMTENVLHLVRGCKQVGIDGFYISTQGGEAYRFPNSDIFAKYIKPTDLAVWEEARSCAFNILHICESEGEYDNLTPFLDYPGQVVNSSLQVGDKMMTPRELAAFFGRPFMGGMDRKGVISSGSAAQIREAVNHILADVPERFILGADCTVPATTPWDNLKVANETAHAYRR